MLVSLKARDVLSKLRTPFARHFKEESLEPGLKGQAKVTFRSVDVPELVPFPARARA